MIPTARTEKFLIQRVDDELIVYDWEQKKSHCLNPTSAKVLESCNGKNTVEDIAQLIENEWGDQAEKIDFEEVVWLALEELEKCNLLEKFTETNQARISRRKAVKKGVLASGMVLGFLLPSIKSIVVPTPAMAKSKPNKPKKDKKGKKD